MPIRGEFPGMVGFVSGFPFPAEKLNIKKRGTGNVKTGYLLSSILRGKPGIYRVNE
jgi:hypothetical protein